MKCAGLIGLLLLSAAFARADETDVNKLKQQRVDALAKARAASIANWKAGEAGFTPILVVERELMEARLLLTANADERVTMLEKQVKLAQELEKLARDALKSGRTNQLPVHLATANRLQWEIALAEAKAKK